MRTKEHARHLQRRPNFDRGEPRVKSWFTWKREVLNLIRDLPPFKAAEVVMQVAEGSIDAGRINRRTYEEAEAWANRLLSGLKPGRDNG